MLRELHDELGIPEDYGATAARRRSRRRPSSSRSGPNLVGKHAAADTRGGSASGRPWSRRPPEDRHSAADRVRIPQRRLPGGLIRKKIEAGQEIEDILTVNAAPGTASTTPGRAVDIATPGSRPLTEEFETTDAFAGSRESRPSSSVFR